MSAVPTRIVGIAIPDNALAREATEFVSDASTRCCSTIHDECSLGCRCGSSGTFIAPASVTSSAASPRLTLVGGPDEAEATEARCEIRVLIADGQALVRVGFRVLLEGDARITVVGEAATGEEAVAEARRLGPDVVLIDAMLPLLAPRLARRLIAELASRPQPECPSPELLDEPTAREREVPTLVALGLSNDEIAERLLVSRATAKTHVSRHDTGALRSIADLWRRLHGPGRAVVVAAANPAVCLNRVIPARWKLTLKPTRDEAFIHLLASPV